MDFGCINKTNDLQLTCSEAWIWGGEDGRDKRKRKSRNEEGNVNAVASFCFVLFLRACLPVQVDCI